MDIQTYWKAVLDQDAAAMRAFFLPDGVVRWHNTNEQFTAEEFIRVNCEYPGHWAGKVLRVETVGDQIITATHVYAAHDPTLSFHVVSFIQTKGEKIAAIDEYWGDDGPAPKWRQELGIGSRIKEV